MSVLGDMTSTNIWWILLPTISFSSIKMKKASPHRKKERPGCSLKKTIGPRRHLPHCSGLCGWILVQLDILTGMGWRKPKREPYYRSDRQAGSRYEQSINANDGTSLIPSFYTESGMSLLRHAAFSAFRPSACISLVVLIYIVKCSIIVV